ncbi:MAG: GNAT family N-acetyltransferase [Lachnospiraceae bacterium]|nr:GNAT family N-acetyltransferase [Lachnospiraceae bacterium]
MSTIKKLTTVDEWCESDRVLSTAFLDPYDEKESRKRFQAQADGKIPREEEAWGVFDPEGKMVTSITTLQKKLSFEGSLISVGEGHMLGSLPESRGKGNVRDLLGSVLIDFRERGNLFAILIPFSFAFYRQFGFELVSKDLTQSADIEQFADFPCTLNVRQLASQADVDLAKNLYQRQILKYNLADAKTENDWTYQGNGEFGPRDWFHKGNQKYTYLFTDKNGRARGYVTFLYVTGEFGPFIGNMKVTEIIFDSPEALSSIFGFFYRLRAKIRKIEIEFLDPVDLATLLPECDSVEITVGGHYMARVLDIAKVLSLLSMPSGQGSFVIHVDDDFMSENTGSYKVLFKDGKTVSVELTNQEADLIVNEDTFTSLAVGRINLAQALYRPGTILQNNEKLLEQVFISKTTCLR